MEAHPITPEGFQRLLPNICDKETSADAEGWTKENPLYAHCAVVALLAQDLFGGNLLRASLEQFPEFAHMRSHYWNQLPDGSEVDFTEPQFLGRRPGLAGKSRVRPQHFETMKRYKLLALRLAKIRSDNNALFDDRIYQACFSAALDSPCQKMKFGCVVIRGGSVVYQGTNKTIPELCSMCEPTCIRFSITSRTESMLGACGHAEEWAMAELVQQGTPLRECELYIAGFFPDGFPWIKKIPEHTCLRCAVSMNFAGLAKVHIPAIDSWQGVSTSEALTTARVYAMKEKTI